jgi:hypothetical protein
VPNAKRKVRVWVWDAECKMMSAKSAEVFLPNDKINVARVPIRDTISVWICTRLPVTSAATNMARGDCTVPRALR